MKRMKILLLGTVVLAMSVNFFFLSKNSNVTSLVFANIEALANNDVSSDAYEKYINVTDKSSNTEFKTEISSSGVKIEYKRTCTAYTTYCKNTGKEGDYCYKSLNGVQKTCDNWEQK